MIGLAGGGRGRQRMQLVEASPLRRADARTKLALSLCTSLAVMLPLGRLAAFMVAYALVLLWARLLPEAGRQLWRLKWMLLLLFVLDTVVVGVDLALLVTLRLVLLAEAFVLFFATTTPRELGLALEWLRVPLRYAFGISLAFQSIALLDDEWRAIREAGMARGVWQPGGPAGAEGRPARLLRVARRLWAQATDLVALSVPTTVLTAKRAWEMTEAAYARGFDAPHRRPYRQLALHRLDWLLLAGAMALSGALFFLR